MPGDDRANPADLEAMMNDPSITLLSQAGLNIGYLAMNVKKPPFATRRKCARRSTWQSTATRSSRRFIRVRARRQEPDPADDLVLQ